MKTKIVSALFFLITTALLLFAASCKKKKEFKNEDGQAAVDVRHVQGETDVALKDMNEAFVSALQARGQNIAIENLTGLFGTVCGLRIDTTNLAKGSIILNYDGSLCNEKKRGGSIVLTVQDHPAVKFKSTNAVVRVDFINYKIIRPDGNSIQFDGVAYMKNLSGDSWLELKFLNLPALVQSFTADDLQLAFNGNNTVFYSISRRSTYTNNGNVLRCAVEGTGSHDGKNNVESFGSTRDKDKFTCEIVSPLVWTSECGPLMPAEGETIIKEKDKAHELKCFYNVDQEGNTSASGCAYGWKISYSYKNKTKTRVFGYDN